jgi:hypothetical protein
MNYANPDLEFFIDEERERCATLVDALAKIYAVRGEHLREQKPELSEHHKETVRCLQMLEQAIRNGYDPRESEREQFQAEKIRLMQEPRTDDQLAFLRLAIEETEPLPRCIHGNCVRDGSGEALEPACGCRADPR